ncbi:MAG TPA: hypothetical protein VFG45_00615 [Candidatus Nitrosocosmicus sp.]|nr:hypothetical protein [Candidatus Nitrosocosmicus sp.]
MVTLSGQTVVYGDDYSKRAFDVNNNNQSHNGPEFINLSIP